MRGKTLRVVPRERLPGRAAFSVRKAGNPRRAAVRAAENPARARKTGRGRRKKRRQKTCPPPAHRPRGPLPRQRRTRGLTLNSFFRPPCEESIPGCPPRASPFRTGQGMGFLRRGPSRAVPEGGRPPLSGQRSAKRRTSPAEGRLRVPARTRSRREAWARAGTGGGPSSLYKESRRARRRGGFGRETGKMFIPPCSEWPQEGRG